MTRHPSSIFSSVSYYTSVVKRFINQSLRARVSFIRNRSSVKGDEEYTSSMTDNFGFVCESCGVSGHYWQFEDVVSGDTICLQCGTVNDTSGQFLPTVQNSLDVLDSSPDPDCVLAEAETGIVSPTLRECVTDADKINHGCAFRMFDQPFDIMAKKCDLMEGLANRRSLIAMRSACERVGITCPEFTLTHNPGVQAAAAYVVATHPPGIDRGRTRLLQESQEVSGLPEICNTLGVTVSAVARCVRNYGDKLHASMRDARRLHILPEFEPVVKNSRLRKKKRLGD